MLELILTLMLSFTLPEPLPETPGQLIYQEMGCTMCHGHQGQGDGFMADGLKPRPRDFTSFEQMSRLSDLTMADSIKNGIPGTAMPAWDLTDNQINDVIKYIKTFLAETQITISLCANSELDIDTANLNLGNYTTTTDFPRLIEIITSPDRVVIRPRMSNVLKYLRGEGKALVRTHVMLSGEESALIVVRVRDCIV